MITDELRKAEKGLHKQIDGLLEQEDKFPQKDITQQIFEFMQGLSGETASHCVHVGEYSRILATELGLPEEQVDKICQAAMLHDLGKIVFPNNIISKPGRLTHAEWELIKKHTVYGYDFLSEAHGQTLQLTARVALEHHERWDGGGYLGKKGRDICLEARIVSLADVFDALVSTRSYKKSWPPEVALAEIMRQGRKQFDPELTAAFEHCWREITEAMQNHQKNRLIIK